MGKSRVRFLSIPKNEKGKTEYDMGIDFSDNLVQIKLVGDDEFDVLTKNYVFAKTNEKFELLISDYESEILGISAVEFMIEQISELKINVPLFLKALNMAKEFNTFLALDF